MVVYSFMGTLTCPPVLFPLDDGGGGAPLGSTKTPDFILRALLRLKTMDPATSATTARPPTIPPIMAPRLESSFFSIGMARLGLTGPVWVRVGRESSH